MYKSSNDQIGYYIEQKPSYEQCIATERAPYMGDYMNAARMSDSTDQGYNYVPNSSANQTDANILSQQQSNIYYTYNNSNIPNNTQPCAPYFVSTVPG
ncbi:unnamed protein product [Anisakis simplex]|uniref:Uncharacterized protein n=1 Tax=Anisakis simplex TaxID=6269 RepID=A0A0M3JEX9_ANISI|nr:unnamed protein product [Anisakis simplex]VDK26353.1 unnamed protein product [Anisakis simplex]